MDAKMKSFRAQLDDMGKMRAKGRILQELDAAISAGDLSRAIMFFNELELRGHSSHPDYPAYEEELANAWKRLKDGAASLFTPQDPGHIAKMRDIHKGERCFILGNLSGLTPDRAARLAREKTISLAPAGDSPLSPTYFAIEDREILAYCEKTPGIFGASTVLMPSFAREKFARFPNTHFFNLVDGRGEKADFPLFGPDASRRLWSSGSAPYLALQLAYHMGFSTVYLVGFDFTATHPLQDKSQRDTAKRGDASGEGAAFDPHKFLAAPDPATLAASLEKADYAFRRAGAKIIDCSSAGDLRLFPREKLEDVLEKSAPRRVASPQEAKPSISLIAPYGIYKSSFYKGLEALADQSTRVEILLLSSLIPEADKGLAKKNPHVQFINVTERDNSKNVGLKNARAPFVAFISPVCRLSLDIIEKSLAKLGETGADMLRIVQDDLAKGEDNLENFYNFTGTTALLKMTYHIAASLDGIIIRRDFLQGNKLAYRSDGLFSDLSFILEAYYKAERAATLRVAEFMTHSERPRNISVDALALEREIAEFEDFLAREGLRHSHCHLFLLYKYRVLMESHKLSSEAGDAAALQAIGELAQKLDLDWSENLSILDAFVPGEATKFKSIFRGMPRDWHMSKTNSNSNQLVWGN